MLKKYLNNPAHLFIDNSPYFITAAIYQKRNLLASHTIKEHLIKTIQESFVSRNWLLNDWVILDNHYHLLAIANVQQNDNVRGELVEPHSTLRQTQGERFYHQIKVR